MSDFTPEELAAMTPEQRALVDWFEQQPDPDELRAADGEFGDLPYDDALIAYDPEAEVVDLERARQALRGVRSGEPFDPESIRKAMTDD